MCVLLNINLPVLVAGFNQPLPMSRTKRGVAQGKGFVESVFPFHLCPFDGEIVVKTLDYLGGDSQRDAGRRNVVRDNTSGPDNDIVADMYTWQNDAPGTDKDIVANTDIRHAGIAQMGFGAGVMGQDMYVGTKDDIVADGDMKAMGRVDETAAQLTVASDLQPPFDEF